MTPELYGLVLAGGASRRMGTDKGTLVYHGVPQALHAWQLLADLCTRAYASTHASRSSLHPYSALPLVLDEGDFEGPAAGLAAAWRLHPDVAWLVLAVDMPLADRKLLSELIEGRDAAAAATAFRHDGSDSDGMIEPLCAIWEPRARAELLTSLQAGEKSPRRFLQAHAAHLLSPSEPHKLTSVNSPAEYEALRRELPQ